MSKEFKLPPLPEWSKMDNLGNLVPSEIRQELQAYALAAIEAYKQQQGEAVPYEKFVAIREGHFNTASEKYFSARPQLDTNENRRIFYAGHCKGYDAAPAQQPLSENAALSEEQQFDQWWNAAHGIGCEKP